VRKGSSFFAVTSAAGSGVLTVPVSTGCFSLVSPATRAAIAGSIPAEGPPLYR